MAPPAAAVPPPFPAWRAVVGVLTLALVVVTGLLFLGLWNSGWFVQVPREFAPPGLSCVVEMPGGVHEATLLPGNLAGGAQYAARRRFPWESFGLAARDLPDDFDESDDPQPPMDAYLRDFFATVPGGVTPAIETVPDATAPVRQGTAWSAKYGNVIARVVFGGPRLYLLVAAGKSVAPARPDVANFFASFRCTDAIDQAAAAAARTRAAEIERHRAGWGAFDRQPYGGAAPADPTTWPGLTHHWRCDGAAAEWTDARGAANGTWRTAPGSAGGVRGQAISFGSAAALSVTFARPVSAFPRRVSTLAFWYRATPGDGRLIDFQPDHESAGTVDLIANELIVTLPSPPRVKPREVRLPRPADADWHHVALVRRADPEPAGVQLWFDGVVAFEGPPLEAPAVETTRFSVGGPPAAGVMGVAVGPGFRAALDEVCLFARALTEAELRQLAAAPEPPAGEPPYWLRADTGLPKPLAYLAWDPATARTGNLPDAVGRRVYKVNGPVENTDAPAGRGYAFTPPSPDPAVNFGALRFTPPPRKGAAVKAGEVAPFTAAVWAAYDGETPLELLRLGELRLVLSRDGASVTVKPTGPPAFVASKLTPGWHHFTLTRSRTGVVQFSVDGDAVPGRVEVSGTDDRSPFPITLGTFPAGAEAETFKLSEFVIFPTAATATQVRRIASVKLAE